MKDEEGLLTTLDGSFISTKNNVGKVMGRMDEVLGKASNSIFCYIIIFTVMIVALLFKMS